MTEKRPYVNFESPEVQIVSLEKKNGFFGGNEWVVKWKKRSDNIINELDIFPNTVGGTAGGGFTVNWGN